MKSLEELLAVTSAKKNGVNDEFTKLLDLFHKKYPNKSKGYGEAANDFPTYRTIRVNINKTHENLRLMFADRCEETGVEIYDWRGSFHFADNDGKFHRTTHGRDLVDYLADNDAKLLDYVEKTMQEIETDFYNFIMSEWKESKICKSIQE